MRLTRILRWTMGIALALFIVGVPFLYYRMCYTYQKRLRVVTPGKVYRSGAMTADGLEQSLKTHGIRTVINLMEEAQDPDLCLSYFSRNSIKESALCEKLGVQYRFLLVDTVPPNCVGPYRAGTFERFMEIMDDPKNYPVLIHCKAGLHRTGVILALYRLEYDRWTREEAIRELRTNGFGEFASSASNDYIMQYILAYQPRAVPRRPLAAAVPATLTSRSAQQATESDPSKD